MNFYDIYGWLPLIGLFVGLVVGATGVGGGALMTPLLIATTSAPLVSIIATDLIFAATTKIAVSFRNLRIRAIDWGMVARVWSGGIPAAFFVSLLLVSLVPSWIELWLVALIGTLVIIAGIRFTLPTNSRPKVRSVVTLPLVGAALGGSVALTSVGAGAFGLSLLRSYWPASRPLSHLVATDIAQAIPIALLAGLVHLTTGAFSFELFVSITPTGVVGAIVGSILSRVAGQDLLKKVLGLVLIGAGVLALSSTL